MPQPNPSLLDAHQRECAKLIRQNCGRHRIHQVFADFCEVSALAISNRVDTLHYEQREQRYLDVAKRYERDEVDRFAAMLGCVVMSLELGFKDCLGQLFMSLELGDHLRGQVFTPYELSSLMARLLIGSPSMADINARGGFISLLEPAVGAGGMVIAQAHALHEAQINYQRHLHVTAVDVDLVAVHMTYVQLSLLHVPAIVIHGNSLSLEQWSHWVTPAHVLGAWDRRLAGRAGEPRASAATECTEAVVALGPSPAIANGLSGARDEIAGQRLAHAEQLGLF